MTFLLMFCVMNALAAALFKDNQMTKETWDSIITTAAIAIIAYTIGYFVGGGV